MHIFFWKILPKTEFCNTPGLCWYDGALETVGRQLWRFRGHNWWYVWCFYVFFSSGIFTVLSAEDFNSDPSDFRLSLIDEHAGGWAQAFHTENYFSHFSCLFKQTVLRENLSKGPQWSEISQTLSFTTTCSSSMFSHLFLFKTDFCFAFCQPTLYCPSVSRAHRCARVCTPHGGQKKNLRRFASTDFCPKNCCRFHSKRVSRHWITPEILQNWSAQPLQSSHTADTNRSAVSMLICCMFVSICTHDLNNLSAFSCFFYRYVFMCSLPEAPGMKFSLEFFVVNSLCRTFHRNLHSHLSLFFQSCQPCEVHNIQVQCRSCTSTIGKKK